LLLGRHRELREPDARIYEGRRPFPEQVAWLGRTGVLRDRRYVELHLAPVRYDPPLGGLRIREELEVVVHFDGAAPPEAGAPPDPRFESLYREAFINYAQSLTFRATSSDETRSVRATASPSYGIGPIQRILVRRHGLVRLDYPRLSETGFLGYDVGTWRLSNRGVQVPLETNDDGDGLLEPGEWVQFWGQALDDEPKTVLNTDFPDTDVDLFNAADFGDVNVYFLTVEAESQSPMAQRESAPTHVRTPPLYFVDTAHVELDDSYQPLGAADPWYWFPTLTAGSPTTDTRSELVALPGLYAGNEPCTVRVHVRGSSASLDVTPDHATLVTLLNATNEELASDAGTFDGRKLYLHEFTWDWPGSGAQLSSPAHVRLEAPSVAGTTSRVALDWIEIDYRREFAVVGEELAFTWPDEDAEFVVGGLSDPEPHVYEITLPDGERIVQPVRLTGIEVSGAAPPYSARFRIDNDPVLVDGTARRFVVAGSASVQVPADPDFTEDTVSDLRDNLNAADLVVIVHPDVVDTGTGSLLDQLLAFRATPQGGGLVSKVARMPDIEDEFNHGLPGPTAIREFLRWVLSEAPGEGWAGKPAYVLLIGDGTYDYKGGTAAGNYVPTQIVFKEDPALGFYASDSLLAAVAGDDSLPDLHLARIPTRTPSESDVVLEKVLFNELAPPDGSWRSRALFISDRGKPWLNPGESLAFEAINETAESYMRRPPYVGTQLRYWTDFYENPSVPDPASAMTQAIWDEVNPPGVALIQFAGHGNFTVWSDDAFFDERYVPRDTAGLFNGQELPWLIVHNCLTGGFHGAEFTMGEDWLKRDGGGAVAVFAPSGLSYTLLGSRVSEVLWERMFGPHKERAIADLVMLSRLDLCTEGSIEPCQQYTALGDPVSRLALHSVDPAHDLTAVAGNAQVDLSWTPSATAGAVYDVYRTTYLAGGAYFKMNSSPLGVPSFSDTTVTNATTYWYYVVASDADGFQSAWSNFNSDCAVAGPDCVEATPLNPDPPSTPTGLLVTDPGVGDQLELDWSANPETDIDYYTVHWGTESGVYLHSASVEDPHLVLRDLVEGQDYFLALTATNTSARTSGFSVEVTDFPAAGMGLRVPSFVEDLTIRVQGADLVLEWTEITIDCYGKPKDVALYEVLRGDSPNWSNASLVKVGECDAPCESWTDPGAFSAPNAYHYRVRAVDAVGNAGGLGSELPESVFLGQTKSEVTPGNLVLAWTPAENDLDGRPLSLSHYAVYAADQPFTREAIRDGLILPLLTVPAPGTSVEFTPPAQNRYYSVLAVDTRGNSSPY
jgi:hypothetical protein